MAVRSNTRDIFKSPERHDGAEQHHRAELEERPCNIGPNCYPTEGFSLEVDGKIKSQHPTREAATTIAAERQRERARSWKLPSDIVRTMCRLSEGSARMR
jgi:hypothetical protein